MLKIVNQQELDCVIDGAVTKAVGTSWEKQTVDAAKHIRGWMKHKFGINGFISVHDEYTLVVGNNGVYHVPAGEQACNCKAGKNGLRCWHRPAARLVRRAIEQGFVINIKPNAVEELFAD